MSVKVTVGRNGRATIELDRVEKRNALNEVMLESLLKITDDLQRREDVRTVVIRGSGGVFCSGADINDWAMPTAIEANRLSKLGRSAFSAVANLPFPTVAVLEGPVIGGGLELALACDIRLAASDCLIGLPETRLGNLPAWGGLARLIAISGLGAARYLLLTGELIDAERAFQLGIVTHQTNKEDLDRLISKTISALEEGDPTAQVLAKQIFASFEHDLIQEPSVAGFTATLETSQRRKRDFLDRKKEKPSEPSPALSAHATNQSSRNNKEIQS
jgi:enoyl-CoA hydratase/carnithine racemase